MICIPCERNKELQQAKLPLLREKAKERAKESGEWIAIYYDNEDNKYYITTEARAINEAIEVYELLSPY